MKWSRDYIELKRGKVPCPGGVASMLATIIYVVMVMPISYYISNDSNLKYESY